MRLPELAATAAVLGTPPSTMHVEQGRFRATSVRQPDRAARPACSVT